MVNKYGKWTWLLLMLVPWFYGPALLNLFARWSEQEEYSHGFVIPLVSLYIVWERWAAVRAQAGSGSWWGVPLLFFALVMLVVGEISALYFLIHYSFIILLLGLSLSLLGTACTRLLLAPILILCFAIPLPYFIEVMLTARLQLWSSELGVSMIRMTGMPVLLSGNIIDLGVTQLEVVEACSGLRYLFPLMSLGFLLAYFYRASFWKRAVVFLSTVPITIVMNSLRIAATGILVDRYGAEMAEGLVHDLEGWVIFACCLVVLVVQVWLLERFTTGRRLLQVLGMEKSEQPMAKNSNFLVFNKPAACALTLCLVTFAGLFWVERRQDTELPATHLSLFPTVLGYWFGEREPLSGRAISRLQLSDYVMINFVHQDHSVPVNFYVAYYANQRKGQSPHSPRVCIPGGGWQIVEFGRIARGDQLVNRAIITRDGERQLVYYWFAERGVVVANEYYKKWLLFQDFVATGRSDGALIRVTTPILPGQDITEADERLSAFIDHAEPVLMSYLPAAENIYTSMGFATPEKLSKLNLDTGI